MKKILVAIVLIVLSISHIFAQDSSASALKKLPGHQQNFIKINLAALLLKNYSFQYERVLTKRLSLAIGYRTSPLSSLPFKNSFAKLAGDDEEAKRQIQNLQLGNTAITPELRLYVGRKGYGKGFYLAPFYRYANYNLKGAEFTYNSDAGGEAVMVFNGKVTSNTYGLLLGSQFFLGKHFTLDMWYLGPHYGTGNGKLTGTPTKALSANEQADIRKSLEDFDIPVVKKTVDVSATSAALTIDGPFAGFRWGIVLGFKF